MPAALIWLADCYALRIFLDGNCAVYGEDRRARVLSIEYQQTPKQVDNGS
jgi:hypothetical protein